MVPFNIQPATTALTNVHSIQGYPPLTLECPSSSPLEVLTMSDIPYVTKSRLGSDHLVKLFLQIRKPVSKPEKGRKGQRRNAKSLSALAPNNFDHLTFSSLIPLLGDNTCRKRKNALLMRVRSCFLEGFHSSSHHC